MTTSHARMATLNAVHHLSEDEITRRAREAGIAPQVMSAWLWAWAERWPRKLLGVR